MCFCMRPSPAAVGAVCSWHPWSRGFVPVRPQCRYSVRQHPVLNYTPAILPWDQSSAETHTHIHFKRLVHPKKMTVLSSFTHPDVFPKQYDMTLTLWHSSAWKRRLFFIVFFMQLQRTGTLMPQKAQKKQIKSTLKRSMCLIHLIPKSS